MDYNGFQTALMAGQVDMAWLYENTGYNAGAEKLRQSKAQYEQGRLDWYYLGEEYLDAMREQYGLNPEDIVKKAHLALEKKKK